jgi:hypothetical protein
VLRASLVGTLGIVTILLLPDLILSLPIEVYWFLRHPLLKIGVFLAVLLLGPPRLAGLVPRRVRRGLSGRTGKARAAASLVDRLGRSLGALGSLRPARVDDLAARVLGRPLSVAVALACVLLFLGWVPHYLTWPWWPDTDQFAVSALSWHSGVLPYRDLADFDFPGPIYLMYLLGRVFGWGKTLPFYAADATILALLGVALAAWSRRRFGRVLPGLVGYLPFLFYYLNLNYAMVGQRDWHGPFFVVLALLALEALPGRAGRLASALAVAAALAYRPQVVLFVPALASALVENCRPGGERSGRLLPLLEWSAAVTLAVVVAFSPLIVSGLIDDFLFALRYARPGSAYGRNNWYTFTKSLSSQLASPLTRPALALGLLLTAAGPAGLRGPARTWALAVLGALLYKPISPHQHAYLEQPLILVRSISLALPVAWLLTTPARLSAPLRLATVAAVLFLSLPAFPRYFRPVQGLQALGATLRGEVPPFSPPGAEDLIPQGNPKVCYRWRNYCRLLEYLRKKSSPTTRVATFLRVLPFPTLNGPSGRLTPFPAAGGFHHLYLVDPGMEDQYAEALEKAADSLVVWYPNAKATIAPSLRYPRLVKLIRRFYRPEVRFGNMEVWRHVAMAESESHEGGLAGAVRPAPAEADRRGRAGHPQAEPRAR